MWKVLWSTKLPTRLIFLIRRILSDTVSTRMELHKTNSTQNPTCLMCMEEPETADHIFSKCEVSRRLWRASRLGIDFQGDGSFKEWLTSWISTAPHQDDITYSFCLIWTIWKHRNAVTSDSHEPNLGPDVENLLQRCNDLYHRHSSERGRLDSIDEVPVEGNEPNQVIYFDGTETVAPPFVQVQTDAAFEENGLFTVGAWCGFDHQTRLWESSYVVAIAATPLKAELLAILNCLETLRNLGKRHVFLISQSITVVKLMLHEQIVEAGIAAEVLEIQSLMKGFTKVEVRKGSILDVRRAHDLAKCIMSCRRL